MCNFIVIVVYVHLFVIRVVCHSYIVVIGFQFGKL